MFLVSFVVLIVSGAGVLFLGLPNGWSGQPLDFATMSGRVFHSVFFSISAFCNAAFADDGKVCA